VEIQASEIPGTVVDLFSFVLRIETAIETPAYVVLRLTRGASEERLVMLERLPTARFSPVGVSASI
jgi:hypothetical protein